MRITANVMIGNMMNNLQENIQRLDNLNQRLASGRKFQTPSQDPVGAATSLEIKDILARNKQYIRNTNQARDWLCSTENALNKACKVLQRGRELAVYGANGGLTGEDRGQLAREVEELKQELVNVGNSRLGDRFLFAGQKTTMQGASPLEITAGGTVKFNGDYQVIVREIGPDITMEINTEGGAVFVEAIETLDRLEEELCADNSSGISDTIEDFDKALVVNIENRAELGAKINRLQLTLNRLEEENLQAEELLSRNEDVDIAEAITDLKMQESVYRSSLATGARIIQPRLVDFLR